MTRLIIRLAPCERLLINGAVLENGDRRTNLMILTHDAHVLRLKDALTPSQANTPVGRICYMIQLILSGDASPESMHQNILASLEELCSIFMDHESTGILHLAVDRTKCKQYYSALKLLKRLLSREASLLSNVLQ
jgi:flagellar protein FlbT